MGYLNDEGLEYYSWLVRNKLTKNVQITKPSSIATFCPASESELEPIVRFGCTETPPAQGEKSVDNPSTLSGVSQINLVRTGKNLLETWQLAASRINGEMNSDGSVHIYGTTPAGLYGYFYFGNTDNSANNKLPAWMKQEKTYTFTLKAPQDSCVLQVFLSNSLNAWGNPAITVTPNTSRSVTVANDKKRALIRLQVPTNTTADFNAYVQVEEGLTATEFEAVSASDSAYSVDFDTEQYGGYYDFATGKLTVDVLKASLITPNQVIESHTDSTSICFQSVVSTSQNKKHGPNSDANFKCNKFANSSTTDEGIFLRGGSNQLAVALRILKSRLDVSNAADPSSPTNEEWISALASWLVNNPVEFTYTLYQPIEYQLDPQKILSLPQVDPYVPRLNTVYSDQESVQVGWIREDFIHKSGNETIEGIKTFSNATPGSTAGDSVTDLTIRNPAVVRGIRGEGANWTRMIFADKDGNTEGNFAGRLGIFEIRSPKINEYNNNGGEQFRFRCYRYSNSLSDYSKATDIILGYDKDGIAYATAPSTSMDRNDATDIVTRDWLPKDTRIPQKSDLWNWQKTEKAGAVSFKPVPESDLEPVVDFMFTETPPAEGEKGPDNPSVITGINEIQLVHKNKNLIPYPYTNTTSTINGVDFTVNSNGSVLINGKATSNTVFYFSSDINKTHFKAGVQYTYSCKNALVSGVRVGIDLYSNVDPREYLKGFSINYPNSSATWISDGNYRARSYIYVYNNTTVSNLTVYPQLEIGDTDTEFEISSSTIYPIPFSNTYYSGTVDLSTGNMTVAWEGVILDGTENWTDGATVGDGVYRYQLINDYNDKYHPLENSNQTCSHFNYLQDWTSVTVHWYSNTPAGNAWFFTDAQTTIADWKSWLAAQKTAGTPVTFAAKVAPFTVQLTPQQIKALTPTDKYAPRVNTIYTNAASVQVGYQRFADEATIVYQDQCISEEEIDEAFAE